MIALGRAEAGVDNTSGADGDVVARVRKATAKAFKWANSASTDEITQAEVGAACYLVDDQESAGNWRGQVAAVTINAASSNNSISVRQNLNLERFYS